MGKLQTAVDRATRAEAAARPYSAGLPRLSLSYKADLPARLHFSGIDQDRIPPIVGIVAEGWTLQAGDAVRRPSAGSHGYDNTCHSMATTFVGWGPAFAAAQGTEVEAFDSVEVYGIVGTALGLPRLAPNNGTRAVRERVLGL